MLDASLALSWRFQDEKTPLSVHVLTMLRTTQAVARALLSFELANGLVLAERRGRITRPEQDAFLELLRQLPVLIDHRPITWLCQQILPLARRHGLTPYDAAYLELAIRDHLPLATLDGKLRAAALDSGIPLVEAEP